ncbi:hypothetical protein DPMN_101464 [Dreissena polymorpha]|uniref:Uncharacterized protein n=1 Tax=Dreissena polymorpha TaxID=45954 RepID=A0A9D4R8C1_DREPO|nr:hypothetical protein DPMN_101464 [Dreissena polymorpha]
MGKTAPPTDGHVCQRAEITFELSQHIKTTNILTNFELDRDRTKYVTSRVSKWKTAPPTGGHVFQRTIGHEIFNLNRGIIETNLLTKIHKDRQFFQRTILRVFSNQMWTTDGRTYDGQRPIPKAHLIAQVS